MIKNDADLKRAQESVVKILESFDKATAEWAKENNLSEKILDGIRSAYDTHYLELTAQIDEYLARKK